MTRSEEIKKVTWTGLIGNSILAFLKITSGIISGSIALVADGLDSSLDVASHIIMLMTSKIMKKKPDYMFPYGYNRVENITTYIITIIIFFVGVQLLYTNIIALYQNKPHDVPGYLALIVVVVSITGKLFLQYWQLKAGKKLNSPMLKASATNMRNDVILSSSVLLGLLLVYVFNMPVIDRIMAVVLSLWIIWIAIKLFRENSIDLMDGVDDPGLYSQIMDEIKKIKGVHNPHRIRIRKMAHKYIVDLDIEVDGKMSVYDAHNLGIEVEERIKNIINNIYDVMLHIEPIGNFEEDEKFGVSRKDSGHDIIY